MNSFTIISIIVIGYIAYILYYQFTKRKKMKKNMSSNQYSAKFQEYVKSIIDGLEEKLEREVSKTEINSLYNAGTFMFLEIIDRSIYYFKTKEKLEAELKSFCEACDNRFIESKKQITERSVKIIKRQLSSKERDLIASSKNTYQLNSMIESWNEN